MEEYQVPDTECKDEENAVEVDDATFIWDPTDPQDNKASKKKKKGRFTALVMFKYIPL